MAQPSPRASVQQREPTAARLTAAAKASRRARAAPAWSRGDACRNLILARVCLGSDV